MKRIVLFIILLASASLLMGCAEEEFVGNGAHFQTESFDNFLWHKHVPDTIKAIIGTDFAESEGLTKPLVLQLCDEEANAIPVQVAQLFVNGVPTSDNTISIAPATKVKETEIWIVLDDSQIHEDRTFTWNLKVADNPGLVRINEMEPSTIALVPETTFHWQNEHTSNSLEVAFWSILLALLAALILIVIISRLNNPAFQVKRLVLNDGTIQKTVVLKGVSKVVCSDKKMSQSFIKQVLQRKNSFIQHDFFSDGEVVITPKSRIMTDSGRRNGGRISAKNYEVTNTAIASGESSEIKNITTNQIITITIN